MKIIILGASGQIGNELKSQLIEIFSTSRDTLLQILEVKRAELDLSDSKAVNLFLNSHSPNWIINASAYTAVDKAELEPLLAYKINKQVVTLIATYCEKNKVNLVHISTDYVFSGNNSIPYVEKDDAVPQNVYGFSKLAGEREIERILKRHIIIRTSWVYGRFGNNFVKTMINLSKIKDIIECVDDQRSSPTAAKSVARTISFIIFKMLDAKDIDQRWGTYHFCGTPFITWADFADEIFYQAHQKGIISSIPIVKRILTESYPTFANRPKNSCLDCSKIDNIFGIKKDEWKLSLSTVLDEIIRD